MKYNKQRRAFLSLFLAILVLCGAITMPIFQIDAYAVTQAEIDAKKAQKANIQSKINAQRAKMNALKDEQADLLTQKEALDQQQTLKSEEVALVREELEMYRQLIIEKEEEARISQENADKWFAAYKKHIRNTEEQGTTNMYLDLLFSSESMADVISRIDNINEILEYDKRVRDNYIASKIAAEQAKKEYEEAAALLEVKEVELQAEIEKLEGELNTLQSELTALQSDIDGYQAVINQYAADEKRIDREIKAMAEELKKQQTPPTSTGSYIWPSRSCFVVTSKYGWRTISLYGSARFHAGIDIGASMGTPIVAADGGNVIVSAYDGGYGNYVMINHGDGRSTLYGHMSSRAVSVGQTVNQGQVIGYVGSTGNSTGPHIHFEIRVNGGTVNPLKYFSGYTYG